jgi:drug/metabolite transporter (DMT)-like permease
LILSNKTKGILLALGASIALANSFIFSKAALNVVNFVQFGFIWFGFGLLWNLLFYFTRKSRKGKKRGKKVWLSSSLVAFLEAVATALFYVAILRMENPAIVSFIGNIGPVFVTILGIIFLNERYGWKGTMGILVTLLGVFVINYSSNVSINNILIPGSQYVIAASFIFAIATILARKFRKSLDSYLLSLVRVIMLFTGFAVWTFVSSQNLSIPNKAIVNMIIGSFLETFITIVFAYQALKYIEAAKTSLIISTKAIFVLISALIAFSIFPPLYKVIGGILTIIGVMILSSVKSKGS